MGASTATKTKRMRRREARIRAAKSARTHRTALQRLVIKG